MSSRAREEHQPRDLAADSTIKLALRNSTRELYRQPREPCSISNIASQVRARREPYGNPNERGHNSFRRSNPGTARAKKA